jgi:hypothetical protein
MATLLPPDLLLRAFVDCTTPLARNCVSLFSPDTVTTYLGDEPCFTRRDGVILLCAECTVFWRSCTKSEDETSRCLAIYLRQLQQSVDVPVSRPLKAGV